MRRASAASLVTHMPASPNAPRFLVGKNDRQPTSPKLPARRSVRLGGADRLGGILDHQQLMLRALISAGISASWP